MITRAAFGDIPPASIAYQARGCRRALCTSTSEGEVVGVQTRKRVEWRPSEVHLVAATSVHRQDVMKNRIKTSALLRAAEENARESLPAGVQSIREVAKQNAALFDTSAGGVGSGAVLRRATSGGSSVAAASATHLHRQRRELERLAAAGDSEAAEALRNLPASVLTSALQGSAGRAVAARKKSEGVAAAAAGVRVVGPGAKTGAEASAGASSRAGSQSGTAKAILIPLSVAGAAAGYCYSQDMLPRDLLPLSLEPLRSFEISSVRLSLPAWLREGGSQEDGGRGQGDMGPTEATAKVAEALPSDIAALLEEYSSEVETLPSTTPSTGPMGDSSQGAREALAGAACQGATGKGDQVPLWLQKPGGGGSVQH